LGSYDYDVSQRGGNYLASCQFIEGGFNDCGQPENLARFRHAGGRRRDITDAGAAIEVNKAAAVMPPKANRIESKDAERAKSYTAPLNTPDLAGRSGQTCQVAGL